MVSMQAAAGACGNDDGDVCLSLRFVRYLYVRSSVGTGMGWVVVRRFID